MSKKKIILSVLILGLAVVLPLFFVKAFTTSSTGYANNGAPERDAAPGEANVLIMDISLPDPGTDTTIAGTAPSAGTAITATKDSDWTTLYFHDATADGGAWDSANDIVFVDDGNVYYDDTKDTKLAGATTENAQGTLTEPSGWDLYYYDKTDGDAWDSANDWIGTDDDSDGVYTSAADTEVDCDGSTSTDKGTCDAHNPGDALTATDASDNLCADDLANPAVVFIDSDGNCNTADGTITNLLGSASGTYTAVGTDWVYVDADSDGAYDDGEDLYIENVSGELTYSAAADTTIAGTAPSAGTAITATKDSDWTTLYFYDAADGGAWDSANDIIFVDDGNIYYDDTKDTHLAGATTENAQGTLTEPSGWNLYYYDKTGGNAWDSANDWIGLDADSSGYYNADKISSVTVSNTGTALDSDISAIKVWQEDGTTAGFQATQDTLIGSDTSPNFWGLSISTGSAVVYTASSKDRIYITANISPSALNQRTIKASIGVNGIQFVSTNDGPTNASIVNPYYQTIVTASSPESVPPTSSITDPLDGATIDAGVAYTIYGTSSDEGGSSVQKVEISFDGGNTWYEVTPLETSDSGFTWKYVWQSPAEGTYNLKTRATDWIGNVETPSSGITVIVATPTAEEEEVVEEETVEEEEVVEETPTEEKPITEMTVEELEAKILEIQQKILELLQQLIEMIKEQILELGGSI